LNKASGIEAYATDLLVEALHRHHRHVPSARARRSSWRRARSSLSVLGRDVHEVECRSTVSVAACRAGRARHPLAGDLVDADTGELTPLILVTDG
jgi:hypothetical protein